MSKRWWVAVLGTVLLAACTSGTPSPSPVAPVPIPSGTSSPLVDDTVFDVPPTSPMKTFTSDQNGFSLSYPSKWKETGHSGDCDGKVCFMAPKQDGQVPAAIEVDVVSWTTPTNLQTAWNTQRQLFINSIGVQPRTVPGTQGNTTLSGQKAKTATYTLNFGMYPATARQTMVLNSSGTVATVLTEISSTTIWDDLDPTFQAVEESFALAKS